MGGKSFLSPMNGLKPGETSSEFGKTPGLGYYGKDNLQLDYTICSKASGFQAAIKNELALGQKSTTADTKDEVRPLSLAEFPQCKIIISFLPPKD